MGRALMCTYCLGLMSRVSFLLSGGVGGDRLGEGLGNMKAPLKLDVRSGGVGLTGGLLRLKTSPGGGSFTCAPLRLTFECSSRVIFCFFSRFGRCFVGAIARGNLTVTKLGRGTRVCGLLVGLNYSPLNGSPIFRVPRIFMSCGGLCKLRFLTRCKVSVGRGGGCGRATFRETRGRKGARLVSCLRTFG